MITCRGKKEKEKREESSQRKLCEIGEHAQLQESEEQEVKSKRQLHEIERYTKDAQVEVTGSGFDEGRGEDLFLKPKKTQMRILKGKRQRYQVRGYY